MGNLDNNTFARRYEQILTEYNITPAELAERFNEPFSKFYKWREGVAPRRSALQKLLDVLPDLSEDFLYRGIAPIRLDRARHTKAPAPVPAVLPDDNAKMVLLERLLKERENQIKELKEELREARAEIREANLGYRDLVKPEFSSQTPIYSPFEVFARPAIGFEQINTKVVALNKPDYPFVSMTKNGLTTSLCGASNRQLAK